MKTHAEKIFWGILLLITAAALIFYGMGYGASILGIPMYKMLLSIALVSWILAKIIFSNSLREHFKIFFPLGLLFMVLEAEIAHWLNRPEDIINNWAVLAAAILADIAIGILIPSKNKHYKKSFTVNGNFGGETEHSGYGAEESFDKNRLSGSTVYIDASKTTKSYVENKIGETNVFYQNTDIADPGKVYELTVINQMGETNVHIPGDWVVVNEMSCAMGEINVRENRGNGARLILRGKNQMGETNII